MYLVVTRTFPPEVGGMQNLMWGLAKSLAKIDLIKVLKSILTNQFRKEVLLLLQFVKVSQKLKIS